MAGRTPLAAARAFADAATLENNEASIDSQALIAEP